MRVVFLAPFGRSPKGTTRARVLPMARAVAARGHDVSVVIPPYDDPSDAGRSWEDRGVQVETLPLHRRASGVPEALWRAAALPALGVGLARRALDHHPDVVHVFKPIGPTGVALGLLAATRSLRARRPAGVRGPALVLDCDDWEGRDGWAKNERWPGWLTGLVDAQERGSLRLCDAVTAASRVLMERAQRRPTRVAYLPNGFDPADYPGWAADPASDGGVATRARLGLDQRPLAVLYTRFFEFGADKPARVWRRLVRSIPNASLLVVGAGKYHQEQRVAAIARLAGVDRHLVFAGWIPANDLPSYLTAAPVAFMPMDDTLANRAKCSAKVLELMWLGRPVVAEAVGEQAAMLVHGETGWLTAPDDVDALAGGLAALLNDASLARKLGAAARERVLTEYNWPRLAGEAERLYEELASSR